MLGCGDDIIFGSTDGEPLGSTTLGAADRNIKVIVGGTDMGYPDGSFDGSNEDKPVGMLFGESLGSYDRNVLGPSDGALEAAKYGMLEV